MSFNHNDERIRALRTAVRGVRESLIDEDAKRNVGPDYVGEREVSWASCGGTDCAVASPVERVKDLIVNPWLLVAPARRHHQLDQRP